MEPSSTNSENGRLCNQILRNMGTSILAEKHNLAVHYSSYDTIRSMGIPLFSGTNRYPTVMDVHDSNFFNLLHADAETLRENINTNCTHFQSKEVCRYFYDYLRLPNIEASVRAANPFRERYGTNDDCFVHVRLGDVIDLNPGASYYLKVLSTLCFNQLYIASDSPEHDIIQEITREYPRAEVVIYEPSETIQFGSTCRDLVLSNGSFSAVIGYLGYGSDVYYPKIMPHKIWHGDMFSIPGWNEVDPSVSNVVPMKSLQKNRPWYKFPW